MKKLLFLGTAALMFLCGQGKASALSFVLDDYDVALHESGPGLRLYWTPILTMPAFLNIEEGKRSDPFPLFRIGTREGAPQWDDLWPKEIYVSFDFSSPEISDGIGGWSRGRLLFNDGVVRWDGPTDFYFGETGRFRVELTDARFRLPGSADIMASISYVQADTRALAVSEPATVLLLGCGLLALVMLGRERFLAGR